jgi:hypothetical protein
MSNDLVTALAGKSLIERLGGACFAPYVLVARTNEIAARLKAAEAERLGGPSVCEVSDGRPR